MTETHYIQQKPTGFSIFQWVLMPSHLTLAFATCQWILTPSQLFRHAGGGCRQLHVSRHHALWMGDVGWSAHVSWLSRHDGYQVHQEKQGEGCGCTAPLWIALHGNGKVCANNRIQDLSFGGGYFSLQVSNQCLWWASMLSQMATHGWFDSTNRLTAIRAERGHVCFQSWWVSIM